MEDQDSQRSRSRDREDLALQDGERDELREERPERHRASHSAGDENFSLYVTNLSLETTDEALRAAFAAYGSVQQANIIKQPITKISRGFAFVLMESVDATLKAMDALNGTDFEGSTIRVEKARRAGGYQKTPGVYMGPAKTRFTDRESRDHERGDRRDRRSRSRSRSRSWDRSRERERERDMYYRGPPPPPLMMPYDMPRYDRYPDPRGDYRHAPPRFDSRDVRSRGGAPGPYMYPSRSPPRYDPRRDGGGGPYDRYPPAAGGFYRGGPPPRY